MALNNYGVMVTMSGQNLLSGVLRKVGLDARQTEDAISKLGASSVKSATAMVAGFVAVKGSLAALKALKSVADDAGEFNHAVAAAGALAGATAKQMGILENAAIKAGIATQFSPKTAANTMGELITGGMSANDATKALIPTLDLAAASLGKLQPPEAGAAIIQVLNQFALGADKAGSVADKLAATATNSALAFNEIQDAMTMAGRSAKTANQDLTGTLASLAIIRKSAGSASVAGAAFNKALLNVSANAKNAKLIQDKYGIAITDSGGKIRPFAKIVFDLEKKLKGVTNQSKKLAVVQKIFGDRGIAAYTSLVNAQIKVMRNGREVTLRGADAYAEMAKRIGQSSGKTAELRKRMLSTFKGQKTLLQGSMQTLMTLVGQSFIATFKPIVTLILKFVNVIIKAVNAIPKPVRNVIAGFIVGAVVLVGLVGATLMFVGVIKLLMPLLLLFKGALIGIAIASLKFMLIFGLIAVAVGATLFAVKVAFDKNLGGIATLFSNLKKKITLAWKAIKQIFTSGGFSGAVMKELNKTENSGLKKFVIGIFAFVHRIKAAIAGFVEGWSNLVGELEPYITAIKLIMVEIGQTIQNVLVSLFGKATNGATVTWRSFGKMFASVLTNVIKVILGFVVVMVKVFSVVAVAIGGVISLVMTMVGWLIKAGRWIKGIFSKKNADISVPGQVKVQDKINEVKQHVSSVAAASNGNAALGSFNKSGLVGRANQQANVVVQMPTQDQRPMQITSVLQVDSDKLASVVQEVKQDDQQRGFDRL